MTFFKIILIYLFIGSVIGQIFALSNRSENYLLPAAMYLLISCYLIFLFFRGRPGLIFGSLVGLFLIQLISIETNSLSYLFNIGLHYTVNFKLAGFSHSSDILGLSNSDFSPVGAGEPETIGFNIVAFVILLLVIVNWKK